MINRKELQFQRYKRIKDRGLVRYLMSYGLMFGTLMFIFVMFQPESRRFTWYENLGICLFAGVLWGLLMFGFYSYKYLQLSRKRKD